MKEVISSLPQGKGRTFSYRSLKGKAAWAIALMGAYFLVVTVVIAYERRSMLDLVAHLEELQDDESRLIALNGAVSRTVMAVNENYFSPNMSASAKVLSLEVEAVLPSLRRLKQSYPLVDVDIHELERSLEELSVQPSRASIADLRGVLHRLVITLDAITNDVNVRKDLLSSNYQRTFNRIAIEWGGFGVLALAIIGALVMAFFRRLASDLDLVRERAVAIVRGYRGPPLANGRDDELGGLIGAVNKMQQDLRQREEELEISRQQYFHKEKMAAVGSLAAAVAHEINNPLAAIVGVAQAIDQECKSSHCAVYGAGCHPEMILEQAKRVMQITRQISEFSVPQSPEPELLDLNGLLRSTCNFVRFDRRFRLLEMILELEPSLPAVFGTADHLVQVAMNLLINAADALEGKQDEPPRIRVVTGLRGGQIFLDVVDNGAGISPAHLDQVFVERFSTKPPGRGSGLGLALCRSLVRKMGGDIVIGSIWGKGTTVTVTLPVSSVESDLAVASSGN